MTDPLRDLERRVDALLAKVELADQGIRADVEAIKKDVAQLRRESEFFVPLIRYMPVERIVFGLVGLVLVAVTTAVISLVVRQ